MSSGFSGGAAPDFFSGVGRSNSTLNIPTNTINNNNTSFNNSQNQFSFRSPLSGLISDPTTQIRRPDFVHKRSLAEFQQNQQGGLGFYLRNVKQRSNYQQHASPISPLSPVDFSPVPSISPEISSVSSVSSGSVNNSRYGFPMNRPQPLSLLSNKSNINSFSSNFVPNLSEQRNVFGYTGMKIPDPGPVQDQTEKLMMDHRLQELEKQLLGDEEDNINNGEEAVSVVTATNSEWSETIQSLMKSPTRKPISPSPTSSSSSCSSTSASPPCPKQSLTDAAVAISDGKPEVAAEILTRLQQVGNPKGTSEQRLVAYMVPALMSRVNTTQNFPAATELFGKEHSVSTHMLYDVSPCFKLGFMAANLAIIEEAAEKGFGRIHVVDFEIGQGGQYMHLLHALAAAKKDNPRAAALSITTCSGEAERLKVIGDGLKALAIKIGVCFSFHVKNLSINELSREKLEVQPDEALVVNFAFKLYKLPDESVSTENLRDELLRRVKRLSPVVMTVVEQEINGNTAPLTARVRDAFEHYGAIFDSLDATISRDSTDRVKIEEGLGRKMGNSVAYEGRDRVERCEVFGKWRARMSMAGFQSRPMSQLSAESLKSKLNSGTRGNPGFTVNEQSGGICFGWMGRTLTVASAWR